MANKTVIYLNTHLYKGTYVSKINRKLLYKDDERLNDLCMFLRRNEPNVVILSEVWSQKMRERIVRNLSDIYLNSWIPECRNKFFKMNCGLLVLSKGKITDTCFETIKDTSSHVFIKRIYGFAIHNVFFCSAIFDPQYYEKNVNQLDNFIKAHIGNRKMIVACDFGIKELSDVRKFGYTIPYAYIRNWMFSSEFVDSYRKFNYNPVKTPGITFDNIGNAICRHFHPKGEHQGRTDFFFVKNIDIVETENIACRFSDHYLIKLIYSSF